MRAILAALLLAPALAAAQLPAPVREALAKAGVAGVIVADLTPDEGAPFEAVAAEGAESALNNLLNIIGRRQGARSVISIG